MQPDLIDAVRSAEGYPAVLAVLVVTVFLNWLWSRYGEERDGEACPVGAVHLEPGADRRRVELPRFEENPETRRPAA